MARLPPRLPPPQSQEELLAPDEFGLPSSPRLTGSTPEQWAQWAAARERHARRFFHRLARQDAMLPPGALTAREIFETALGHRRQGSPKGSRNREIDALLLQAHDAIQPCRDQKAQAARAVVAALLSRDDFKKPASSDAQWRDALVMRLDRLLKAREVREAKAQVNAARIRNAIREAHRLRAAPAVPDKK